MTGARTPRQQRGQNRREALCAAATRLAAQQGPAACTARAIATEAGLPLAAVSYYFPDLSVVVGEAVRRVGDRWRAHARDTADRAAASTPIDRTARATAIAAAILPPGEPDGPPGDAHSPVRLPGRAAVITRYRHLVAAADNAAATAEMADLRSDLVTALRPLLPDRATADLLVTVVDGAALGAVAEGDPDPARRVVAAVEAALARLG